MNSLQHYSLDDWKGILRRYRIRPRKRLGQNFLLDPKTLESVVSVAGLTGAETILEIGAGVGTLTRVLAEEADQVIAVELDDRLIPALEAVVSSFDNVKVVLGDILTLKIDDLVQADTFQVVSNIPFNITSAVIRHLLEASIVPASIVLTIQQEVAERIVAEPGSMSLLALSVQVYGSPRIAMQIPAQAFYPVPKVDSAVVRIDTHPRRIVPTAELEVLFQLARAGFGQRRKQLRNALSHGLGRQTVRIESWLDKADIPANARAQELGVEEWVRLAKNVISDGGLQVEDDRAR